MYVVTGGGTGIGRALALALAQRGQHVLIAGRRKAPLIETAEHSSFIDYVVADVTRDEGQEAMAHRLASHCVIQGLVHNAGVIEPIMPLASVAPSAWHACLASHLNAPVFLTQRLQSRLKKGRVLHIGSGASSFPVVGWGAYCVAKAALAMLTRCWQAESSDIAFASVKPGIIDTPMQARIRESEHMDPDKQHFFKQLQAQHALLTTTTVASFLTWLLLDVPIEQYRSQEWDIYDTTHHEAWLLPPATVPPLP